MAVRRGRVTADKVRGFLGNFEALSLVIEPALSPEFWPRVLELGQEYRLTAYDAAYLELAQRTGLPLATLDEDLKSAAATVEVQLL